jgi:hypothetical protein
MELLYIPVFLIWNECKLSRKKGEIHWGWMDTTLQSFVYLFDISAPAAFN